MTDRRPWRQWLAALLLLFSPAVGGTLLPWLHPCPVDSPWLTEAAGSEHAGHHGGGGGAAHQPGQPCTCPGGCSVPSLTSTPTADIATETVPVPETSRWPAVEFPAGRHHVLDRLPESTAPPLV